MISDFLKRQKNSLEENRIAMEKELSLLKTEKEETQKFISILDGGRDKMLHMVSPVSSEDVDEKKIRELKNKLHLLDDQIQNLELEHQSLTKLLDEYEECIDDAFDLEIKKGKYDQFSMEQLDTEKKEDFNYKLLSEQDQEKRNAARELFDSFSPLFTIATHRLDIAQRYMDVDPQRSKKEIVDASDTVESCISEMNRILSMISPIDYQNKSLKDALDQEFLRMKEALGVKVHLDYQINMELNSKVICSAIFQMLQEVCSCMVLHEKPEDIYVTLKNEQKKNQRQVQIYISDEKIQEAKNVSEGISSKDWYQQKLCLVKEKIYLLSGNLEIRSISKGGTSIQICIPYKE